MLRRIADRYRRISSAQIYLAVSGCLSNWNAIEPVVADNPVSRTSTWGGGSGLTIIYGVAAPVKTPLLGQVRKY